jgi:hypothetical protein
VANRALPADYDLCKKTFDRRRDSVEAMTQSAADWIIRRMSPGTKLTMFGKAAAATDAHQGDLRPC